MSEHPDNSDPTEPLCDEGCDETFSEFLSDMAEQNAKVATCPKCGKIHGFGKAKAHEGASQQRAEKAS